MRRKIKQGGLVLLMMAILGLSGEVRGAEFNFGKSNQEVGVRFAYGKSNQTARVHLFSILPRWGIHLLRPGSATLGGLGVTFVAEGIISVVDAENTGAEVGITPLLKLTYPVFRGGLLFLEGGAGLILESFDSPVIASTFNFSPQIGGGLEIALQPQLGLTFAYRFRHTSNAGLYKDNQNFNAHFFQAGLTYYY